MILLYSLKRVQMEKEKSTTRLPSQNHLKQVILIPNPIDRKTQSLCFPGQKLGQSPPQPTNQLADYREGTLNSSQ